MDDTINAGIPSDRVEATWRLTHPRVVALSRGLPPDSPAPEGIPMLLTGDKCPEIIAEADGVTERYLARIPSDLRALPTAAAIAWRMALRQTLQTAFGCGYSASDFIPECSAYMLHKTAR
jgi:predicted GNAT superfamily acetyltransferase